MKIVAFKSMIEKYFPKARILEPGFSETHEGRIILKALSEMERTPIGLTRFNQMLHLMHEAGVSEGFFRFYFLSRPKEHPYLVAEMTPRLTALSKDGISGSDQLEWGWKRFIQDALLRFGNIRAAFVALRTMSYDEVQGFFSQGRFDTERMRRRERMLDLQPIAVDDRHLIAELAVKAYESNADGGSAPIEEELFKAYKKKGGGRISILELVNEDQQAKEDGKSQGLLDFLSQDVIDDHIENEAEIKTKIGNATRRFQNAREAALENTRLYLSIANELDVYVATSMRGRKDFRDMARDCKKIFDTQEIKGLNLRYFDPTMSASNVTEDKGLVECLMVKCAKVLVYFAGKKDSYGKDTEAAMALSLGKPVIIVCPGDASGKDREGFFRDIHPLSRLIEFESGVACGAIVTQDLSKATQVLSRIFRNAQEYDLEHDGGGYFRLREHLTQSVVRLQTSDPMIRETFWNYYHADRQRGMRSQSGGPFATWRPR